MSEPVGNGPRNLADIPGNSHKDRKETPPKVEPPAKEPAQKIVVGKVVTRKAPWWKRFARSMVADDATDIGDFILLNVIIPSTKNLIRDVVVRGTEWTLYGSARGVGSGVGSSSGSLRTRYDKMGNAGNGPGEPRKMLSREARATHSFQEVVLPDREEAIGVVEALIQRINLYGQATVSDLYDFCGVTGSYTDRSWGWNDLSAADVAQTRGGWLLDLPSPIHLTR